MGSVTNGADGASRSRLGTVRSSATRPNTAKPPQGRRALLLAIGASAVVAVFAGLVRLGFGLPGAEWASDHGPLLVLGVFASVVSLERAVALGARLGYGAPLLGVLGAAALVAHSPAAPWFTVGACAWLVVINAALVRRQPAAFTWLMLLGSIVLSAGTFVWALGNPVFVVAPTWMGFFVLTIVAERLELSRLAPTPRWASRLVVVLAVVLAASSSLSLAKPGLASRAMGGVLCGIALWQVAFDLARRTVRWPGLPRFAAIGVLMGTGWMALAGVVLVWRGWVVSGPIYDAVLHAVFVGFVLSMVFAHAPIILPAVARIAIPFHRALYVPLGVLHAGVLVRIVGDLAGLSEVRRVGGALNAVALASFLAAVAWSKRSR